MFWNRNTDIYLDSDNNTSKATELSHCWAKWWAGGSDLFGLVMGPGPGPGAINPCRAKKPIPSTILVHPARLCSGCRCAACCRFLLSFCISLRFFFGLFFSCLLADLHVEREAEKWFKFELKHVSWWRASIDVTTG